MGPQAKPQPESEPRRPRRTPEPRRLLQVLAIAAPAALLALAGCGSGPSGSLVAPGGPNGRSTTVVVQLSSAANDQLSQFTTGIESIALTDSAGKTTTIYNSSTPGSVEFIGINGAAYPLATVQVPQDTYTSAAVTVSGPQFLNVYQDSSGELVNAHGGGGGVTPVAVTLAEPLVVSGPMMGMTLSLAIPKALTGSGVPTLEASLTFELNVFPVTAESTTPLNGKCNGLAAQVTSIDASANTISLTLTGGYSGPGIPASGGYPTGATFSVSLGSGTQFQGIPSSSGLAVGTFLNVDLALEPDGSYRATRVEVQDAMTANVTAGLLIISNPAYKAITQNPVQFQGKQLGSSALENANQFFYDASTKFQVSTAEVALSGLPFTPTFGPASLIAGQMVSIGAMSYPTTGGTYALPTTVTLLPQTIEGTVTATSISGGYAIYTVQLAPYDTIVQTNLPDPGHTDLRLGTSAAVLTVYEGLSGATLADGPPPSAGQIFRFHGLLFDDGGALRMVADQHIAGVPE